MSITVGLCWKGEAALQWWCGVVRNKWDDCLHFLLMSMTALNIFFFCWDENRMKKSSSLFLPDAAGTVFFRVYVFALLFCIVSLMVSWNYSHAYIYIYIYLKRRGTFTEVANQKSESGISGRRTIKLAIYMYDSVRLLKNIFCDIMNLG